MLKKFLCTAGVLSIAAQVFAAVPQVILSDILTDPSSDVPGFPGAKFQSFDRPFASPNGQYWILAADTDLATTMDEVVLVSRNGVIAVEAQEGTEILTGENWGLIDTRFGINDIGAWVGATNTDAATTMDEVIVLRDENGNFSVVAREGDPIPAISGATYGGILDSASIQLIDTPEAGLVSSTSFRVSVVGSPTANAAALTKDGGEVIVQGGDVAAPLADLWAVLDVDDSRVTQDGLHHLIQGDTNGLTAADDILSFDGAVVLQEAVVIPGSGFADPIDLNGIVEPYLAENGDWFGRGDNANTQQDWLVRNGEVVVATGDPVPGGLKGETFSDAPFAAMLFLVTANGNGDYIFGATTSNADALRDAVIVYVPGGDYNNATVILRQSDGVDLDGNGDADDNVFLNVFNNDDAFLTNDGQYYFTADVFDDMQAALGQAFMVVDLSAGGLIGDMNCDGVVSVGDIGAFVLALTDPAGYAAMFPKCDINNGDINGDTIVSVGDIGGFVALLTGGL